MSTVQKKKNNDENISTAESAEAVAKAKSALGSALSSRPSAEGSTGSYKSQISSALDELSNREQFSYNPDGDALYRQYKDSYINSGKRAMQDTVGQASALTGGYANSYAQTAGQQAYNNQIQKLNDIVPELYKLAYTKYTDETKDLYNRLSALSDADQTEYDRYRDSVSDWYNDIDMLYNAYTDARDFDYTKTTDDRNFAYSKERDAISDAQNESDNNENVRQYNQSPADEQRQFDASLARAIAEAAAKNSQSSQTKSSSSGSSSNSSSSDSSSSKSSSGSSSASKDAADALADVGYSPSQQKTIITMLESYKADYDNAAGNIEAQNYAVNLALAYLSGLEHQENNAYIFEKIFGFVPDELSGDSKSEKSSSSGGIYRL